LIDGSRPGRIALLLAIATAHFLILAWFLTRPPVELPPPRNVATSIQIAPLPGEAAVPEQSKPVATSPSVVSPFVPVPLDLPSPRPVSSDGPASSTAGPTGGGGCELGAKAGAAIEQNRAAMAELAAFPPGIRTEADAVLLWNQAWLETPSPIASAAGPQVSGALRRRIVAIVAAAPAACREATAVGPSFIPIRESGRTTMLVVGSGAWRWDDLIRTDPDCQRADANPVHQLPAACSIRVISN
jgi:hypothetical protein